MSDPPPVAQQQATRELEHRLRALNEFAAIVAARASIHSGLSLKHGGFWLGDWEAQKATRFLALAAILAAPEFAGFVRGHVGLRELLSRDPQPPLPKRPRVPNHRRSRAKPRPIEDGFSDPFDLGKWTWPDWSKL